MLLSVNYNVRRRYINPTTPCISKFKNSRTVCNIFICYLEIVANALKLSMKKNLIKNLFLKQSIHLHFENQNVMHPMLLYLFEISI